MNHLILLHVKPLFIPLKSEFYDEFCDGTKDTEFRMYGPRWNENTCRVGRLVTISKGYGIRHRRTGVIKDSVVQIECIDQFDDWCGSPSGTGE